MYTATVKVFNYFVLINGQHKAVEGTGQYTARTRKAAVRIAREAAERAYLEAAVTFPVAWRNEVGAGSTVTITDLETGKSKLVSADGMGVPPAPRKRQNKGGLFTRLPSYGRAY